MKRALVLLAILGFAFSPLMVTQAEAAPVKHHHVVKHHRKVLKKHVRRVAHRRHHKRKAV